MDEAAQIGEYRNRYPKYSQQRQVDAQNAQAESDPEKKQRIKIWMGWCLVLTALTIEAILGIFDLVGIGEFINWLISPVVDFLFIIWFWILGVSFMGNTKRVAVMFATAIVGLIPILNWIPEITLGVGAIALLTIAEDKGGIIGKATSIATSAMQKKAYNKQVDNMERLGDSKPHVGGNANTLDLKNKNTQTQAGQSPQENKQQEEKNTSNQSAASDREISTLKKDIERYQSELSQYQAELATKERYYKESQEGFVRGLETIRSSRDINKEEEAGWYRDHDARMASFHQDINRIKSRIGGLQNLIPSLNNQVAGLERKASTARTAG